MPIFELIGAALDFTPASKYTEEYNLTNSSYSSIIGDNTAFIIGGGRNTNIYGTDVKLVIDWEEFIVNYATGGSSSETLSNKGMIGLGLLFGIGGDSGMLVGNKSDFKYWGEDFSVARQRHEFKCTVPQSHDIKIPTPLEVKIALGLGTIGLLLASLIARFEFGLYSTASATQYPLNTSIVATVIPAFETRWLFVMKLIEYGLSFLSATESELVHAESSLASAKNALVAAQAELKTLESTCLATGPFATVMNDLRKRIEALVANVTKTTEIVTNKTTARAAAYEALVNSSPKEKSDYATSLKTKADAAAAAKADAAKAASAALALIPITTQITADQYGITCNTFTVNDNKSLINLVSADSKSEVAAPFANVSGSIILRSSTIILDSNGNSSIKMLGGALNPDPSISLSTTGTNCSSISLSANTEINPLGASITASTCGVTIGHGIEGDSGSATISNEIIKLSLGVPDVGPSITITPISIIFQVGETIMTITAEGIFMVAPAVGVACGQTNIVINEIGIVEQIGENSRILNDEGHSLSAAETELNVGVEGVVSEAPTMAVEFEASSELSATENSITGDAMLSLEAAIIMSE